MEMPIFLQAAAWTHDQLLVLAFTSLSLLLLPLLIRRLMNSWWRKVPAAAAADHQSFPPEPPGAYWPILGHLPFLSSGCPHHALAHLAQAPPPTGLGPIIGLRLGCKLAVVVCNSRLAKEALHTHDKILANRPRFTISDHAFYGFNNAIAFTTYNPRWSLFRKLCTLELFTPKRLHALQPLRHQEVRTLIRCLHDSSRAGTQPVDLMESFFAMTCNTIGRVLHSKPLAAVQGDLDYFSLIKEQEKALTPTVGDFFPWLKFLDLLPKRAMKSIHRRTDQIIESMISQRRQLLKSRKTDEPLPQDLLQVLLSREAKNQNDEDDVELLHINEIKGIIMDIVSAGTHTTALTLEWAMAELLRNPRCMLKLRAEIDAVIGMEFDRFVTDEDIPKLPYLEQVIKEVFRLHPALPLLIAHAASKVVTLDKYTLPANTLVFVNVWAIGRDPDVWENPQAFWPERFDGKEMDLKGQHYDMLPFGAGRRICPGLRLAMSVLHVTVANLVRTFEWELPNGQKPEELDMSEQRGITITRSTPLLAIPKSRLLA